MIILHSITDTYKYVNIYHNYTQDIYKSNIQYAGIGPGTGYFNFSAGYPAILTLIHNITLIIQSHNFLNNSYILQSEERTDGHKYGSLDRHANRPDPTCIVNNNFVNFFFLSKAISGINIKPDSGYKKYPTKPYNLHLYICTWFNSLI